MSWRKQDGSRYWDEEVAEEGFKLASYDNNSPRSIGLDVRIYWREEAGRDPLGLPGDSRPGDRRALRLHAAEGAGEPGLVAHRRHHPVGVGRARQACQGAQVPQAEAEGGGRITARGLAILARRHPRRRATGPAAVQNARGLGGGGGVRHPARGRPALLPVVRRLAGRPCLVLARWHTSHGRTTDGGGLMNQGY